MVCQGRKENLMILKDLYIGQNLDHLRYKFTIHLEPPSDEPQPLPCFCLNLGTRLTKLLEMSTRKYLITKRNS